MHSFFLIHVKDSRRTLPLAIEATVRTRSLPLMSPPVALQRGRAFGVFNDQDKKTPRLVTFRNRSNVAKTVYAYERTCAVKASNPTSRHCQHFILSPLLSVAEAFLAVFTLCPTPQKASDMATGRVLLWIRYAPFIVIAGTPMRNITETRIRVVFASCTRVFTSPDGGSSSVGGCDDSECGRPLHWKS